MPSEKELIYQIAVDTATVKERMEDIKEQLEGTVPKGECTQRHIVVANSIDGLKRELIAEFKKVPTTGTGYPAITEGMLNRSKEDQKERKRKLILYWLTVLGTSTTLLTGTLYGAWRIFSYMNTINESLVQTRKEIKTGMSKSPHVVYVTVPALTPDSGVLKATPKRRIRK
jgi:hypothetical protein